MNSRSGCYAQCIRQNCTEQKNNHNHQCQCLSEMWDFVQTVYNGFGVTGVTGKTFVIIQALSRKFSLSIWSMFYVYGMKKWLQLLLLVVDRIYSLCFHGCLEIQLHVCYFCYFKEFFSVQICRRESGRG